MKKWVNGTAIVLALMGLSMKSAYAIDTTTVNEKWGKPTVIYGSGNTSVMISSVMVQKIDKGTGVYKAF